MWSDKQSPEDKVKKINKHCRYNTIFINMKKGYKTLYIYYGRKSLFVVKFTHKKMLILKMKTNLKSSWNDFL